MAAGFMGQCGEQNKAMITPQLPMSIATMEEEIADVNVRLNQAMI